MVAYDNNRYGSWLPDFWVMLTTLLLIRLPSFVLTLLCQPLFEHGLGYLDRVNGSKMNSGWLSILQNEKQVLVNCRNVSNFALPWEAHYALANQKEAKM